MEENVPEDYVRSLEDERDDLYLEVLRAREAIAEMEDTIDDLKTRLILRQEELLGLYRP